MNLYSQCCLVFFISKKLHCHFVKNTSGNLKTFKSASKAGRNTVHNLALEKDILISFIIFWIIKKYLNANSYYLSFLYLFTLLNNVIFRTFTTLLYLHIRRVNIVTIQNIFAIPLPFFRFPLCVPEYSLRIVGINNKLYSWIENARA